MTETFVTWPALACGVEIHPAGCRHSNALSFVCASPTHQQWNAFRRLTGSNVRMSAEVLPTKKNPRSICSPQGLLSLARNAATHAASRFARSTDKSAIQSLQGVEAL